MKGFEPLLHKSFKTLPEKLPKKIPRHFPLVPASAAPAKPVELSAGKSVLKDPTFLDALPYTLFLVAIILAAILVIAGL